MTQERGKLLSAQAQKKAEAYMDYIYAQIKEAQQLTESDMLNMDILKRSIEKWMSAEELIEQEGTVLVKDNGTYYEHPACHVAQTALAKIMDISTQYGLTAMSRKKLAIQRFEESPIEELLRRQKALES